MQTLKKVLMLIVLAIIVTHYFEGVQTIALVQVKNLFLTGSVSKFNEESFETSYGFSDQFKINPVHISQSVEELSDSALNCYVAKDFSSLKKLASKKNVDRIVRAADFLISIGVYSNLEDIEYIAFPYNFDYPSYANVLTAPWYSGMAQGLAIKTFLSAYVLTGDIKYFKDAQLSANLLKVPVASGGVAIYLGDSGVWFEEYAKNSNPCSYALNGHIFAVCGLERLVCFDKNYNDLLKKSIAATATMLPKFNALFYSRYDLVKYMANPSYHQIHIDQLEHLKNVYTNSEFKKFYYIFLLQKYIPLGVFYRLLFYPHNSLLIATVLNIIIVMILFRFVSSFRERKLTVKG
ncbi:MAG: D-glucuronyl C5-epimerase family protein [Candidatus Riflebacteria bacterium]|nr:D-glucuronyl C5-epimerase family protein [Candidatus Riflebacteria bacterium]